MAVQIYARISSGIVAELWPHDPAAPMPDPQPTPVQAFGETPGSQFVPCDASVQQGWTTADGGKTFAAPVVPPPTPAQLTAYATSALAAKFAAGETFNVAASGSPALPILCDGTNDTRADLALLALFGQQNPSGTKTWIDNEGVATALSGTQLVTLSTLAGNWISDCYPVLASVLAGIASGKVTTTAQVDAALAAVTA